MTTQATTPAKFEIGKTYEMSFIGDSNLRPHFLCIKRTEKTATFQRVRGGAETLTRKIKTYSGAEYVLEGNYSMAPSINSKREVK
jgi:hypothetical protein